MAQLLQLQVHPSQSDSQPLFRRVVQPAVPHRKPFQLATLLDETVHKFAPETPTIVQCDRFQPRSQLPPHRHDSAAGHGAAVEGNAGQLGALPGQLRHGLLGHGAAVQG
uniref:(northern house mosquito) hypothetical protein n=1 Tax=Culex pipiens TaxID=7175 RepID=A0A8D8CCS7_CULPI